MERNSEHNQGYRAESSEDLTCTDFTRKTMAENSIKDIFVMCISRSPVVVIK